ncbi:cytochrome P450 [Suillus lakei]|nr:cytochrome P450 [Suillus lakei]
MPCSSVFISLDPYLLKELPGIHAAFSVTPSGVGDYKLIHELNALLMGSVLSVFLSNQSCYSCLDLLISDNVQLVLNVAACLGVVGLIARASYPRSKSGLPLPPSPPNWRLMGHSLPPPNNRVPSLISAFLTVAGWIEEYGPLITIRAGTEKVVIIGRHDAAVDIMEKQGGSLTDRPRMNAGHILTGGLVIGFTPAGDRFRRMRRSVVCGRSSPHLTLQRDPEHYIRISSLRRLRQYQPLQMSFAKNTVLSILDDPSNFQHHTLSYAMTTIMTVAFGKTTPTSAADPEVKTLRRLMVIFRSVLRPGAYLVDSIPWLKYLPWYGQTLKRGFEDHQVLFADQMNRLKQQIQSNADVSPSFGKHLLENGHLYGLTKIEMDFLAGAFFAAGADTTAAAICTVLMAAACFPEEQAKVQAELDAVIGRHRAPTFADQQSLPLLGAFVSEALRWRPLGPEGFPHRTTKDVIWASAENYCIPAGTTVLGNLWAISRDPKVYPEPDAFKPQRWIDDQGCLRDDLTFFTYGFGRRICPGLHVANRSILINSFLILWAFQLTLDPTKPLDDLGFLYAAVPNVPCPIDFQPRVPDMELRRIMQNYPEVE